MPSAWIAQTDPINDPFKDFLDLYDALKLKQTSDPGRLILRISNVWRKLSFDVKKHWTHLLLNNNRLEDKVAFILKEYHNATIINFT